MKVIIFGSTGMVGQGALLECLKDDRVEKVLTIGRQSSSTGIQNSKLREIKLDNLFEYQFVEAELTGYDSCLFCLGVSSGGMKEQDYAHLTFDLTLAAAKVLSRLNPGMTFTYVSGSGTDSSEKGRVMWARVKGRTENALLKLPFKAAYMFRPGVIQPMDGIKSKTPSYRLIYSLIGWAIPALRVFFPKRITTTEKLGRAMLEVCQNGYAKKILETADIEIASR